MAYTVITTCIGATIYPHDIGIGATRDAASGAKHRSGHGAGDDRHRHLLELCAVVAVPQDIRWGRTFEATAKIPTWFRACPRRLSRGCKGRALGGPQSVLATPKHFVGDGGTKWGSSTTSGYNIDQGVTEVDEATLRAIHLPPYVAAIKAGAQSIMVSYSSWGGMKMSAQNHLMTDVLKGELGFKGFLVSDWMAIDQISPITTRGCHGDQRGPRHDHGSRQITRTSSATLRDAVNQRRRSDVADRRCRAADPAGQVRDGPVRASGDDPSLLPTVGSAAHRALARQAVERVAGAAQERREHAAAGEGHADDFRGGDGANDIGIQSGGWTMEWQGVTGNRIPGTSILGGHQAGGSSGTTVTYDNLGRFLDAKDAQGNLDHGGCGDRGGGEKPYAEGKGDKADLSLSGRTWR